MFYMLLSTLEVRKLTPIIVHAVMQIFVSKGTSMEAQRKCHETELGLCTIFLNQIKN